MQDLLQVISNYSLFAKFLRGSLELFLRYWFWPFILKSWASILSIAIENAVLLARKESCVSVIAVVKTIRLKTQQHWLIRNRNHCHFSQRSRFCCVFWSIKCTKYLRLLFLYFGSCLKKSLFSSTWAVYSSIVDSGVFEGDFVCSLRVPQIILILRKTKW